MEQTIKNMELALTNIESEIELGNIQATKTLLNTYQSLISKFFIIPNNKYIAKDIRIKLLNHKERFDLLYNLSHEKLTNELTIKSYKTADKLSYIIGRIDRSIRDLKHFSYIN